MARVISATAAAKNFGGIVDRVRQTGTEYVVERGGRPVARIAPLTDRVCTGGELARLLATVAPPEAAFARAVQAESRRRNRPVVPKSPWAS